MSLTTEQARAANATRKTFRGGRPRKKGRRCPCGDYLLATAKKRGHVCVAKPAQ
jgi:hypothetical protein